MMLRVIALRWLPLYSPLRFRSCAELFVVVILICVAQAAPVVSPSPLAINLPSSHATTASSGASGDVALPRVSSNPSRLASLSSVSGSLDEDRPMTASELFAEARAHSSRLMEGGLVQFIEWFLVLLLVAPGTFPVITCVLLSCTSFVQRRLGIAFIVPPPHAHAVHTSARESHVREQAGVVESSPTHRGPRPRSTSFKSDIDDRHGDVNT
ncbi:unnamed protein product [Agarophyton chilense]